MVSSHDEELLQLYLDRELPPPAVRDLEGRLSREPGLAARLETILSLRDQRIRTIDFGQPAKGSLDQLMLSLRAARASELIAAQRGPTLHRDDEPAADESVVAIEMKPAAPKRSFWTRPRRLNFIGGVAAMLAIGTVVGVSIDRSPAPSGAGGAVGTFDTSSLVSLFHESSGGGTGQSVTNNFGPADSLGAQFGTAPVVVRVVREDGKTFHFRFPNEESADAWMSAMYDRLARENLESKFDFEATPVWY